MGPATTLSQELVVPHSCGLKFEISSTRYFDIPFTHIHRDRETERDREIERQRDSGSGMHIHSIDFGITSVCLFKGSHWYCPVIPAQTCPHS